MGGLVLWFGALIWAGGGFSGWFLCGVWLWQCDARLVFWADFRVFRLVVLDLRFGCVVLVAGWFPGYFRFVGFGIIQILRLGLPDVSFLGFLGGFAGSMGWLLVAAYWCFGLQACSGCFLDDSSSCKFGVDSAGLACCFVGLWGWVWFC